MFVVILLKSSWILSQYFYPVQIHDFKPRVFRVMTGNALTSLAPGSFSRYQSLMTLDLSQNLFTTVPSESFVNLSITSL